MTSYEEPTEAQLRDPKRLKEAEFKAGMCEANAASVGPGCRAKAPEFFDSAPRRARDIADTVKRTGRCTVGQMTALDAILHGLHRRVHGGEDA
jgi:hypothetical protein